jgi:hypothetical protein
MYRGSLPKVGLRIVAVLLSQHEGRLFATTDSQYMKKTLDGAGFVQNSQEWNG